MLNNLLFLSTCIAMAWIIYWLVTNDRRSMTSSTIGLFAMRQPDAAAKTEKSKR